MSDSTQSTTPPTAPDKENRRNAGALWTKTNSSGEKFLSGKIKMKNITGVDEEVTIMVFKNVDKKNERSPDFTILLTTDEMKKRLPPEVANKDIW